jgi:lactoylglutathione lyase
LKHHIALGIHAAAAQASQKGDAFTMMHTSVFVNNMDESIKFYTEKLGLKLLDGPIHYEGNADMAFVGKSWDAYVELVYDLEDHPPYDLGNRVEHIAMDVDGDFVQVIESLRESGVKVLSGPKKSPSGKRWIAFVQDPNGIPVELLEPMSEHAS